MQLRDFADFFQPEEFAAFGVAYDSAWSDLWATRLTLTAAQAAVLKKNLVQILLAAACHGIHDADQLKEIALRGVSGRHQAFTLTRGAVSMNRLASETEAL